MTEKITPNQPQVIINAQYIKDCSFENPNAPKSLLEVKKAPNINVSVDVQAQKIKDDTFEVTLTITAEAKAEESSLFLIELSYSGIFTISAEDKEREAILMIYCPTMLFPFARRIISDVSRDGGFPPIMLDPIDFANLYVQHKGKKKEEA